MISYVKAVNLVFKNVRLKDNEIINLDYAFERVSSANVYSATDIPSFNRVTMDGFAVREKGINDSSHTFNVIEAIKAGEISKKIIRKNQAIKVMTGCVLPKSADKVIKIEDTQQIKKNAFRVLRHVSEKNIAFKGQDCKKGSLLLNKNTVIRPYELSMLVSAGVNKLKVFRKPRVFLLATGDEVVELGAKLKDGFIKNSTSLMLRSLLISLGIEINYLGIAKDNKKILKDKIISGIGADILIITGGVSAGDFDYIPKVLDEIGVKKIFHKVSIKPGKPIWFGKKNNTLVFGLPGNPVSTLIGFMLFIKPALLKMQGQSRKLDIFQGLLSHNLLVSEDRLTFRPAKAMYKNGEFRLSLIQFNTSADMKAITEANSFLISKPGKYILNKNSKVEFIFL